MSSVSDNLFGAYTHKLDPKNRIAIPAEWRPSEGCALLLLSGRRLDLPTVKAYTREKFQQLIDKIETTPGYTEAQIDLFIGKLYANCVEADTQTNVRTRTAQFLRPARRAERIFRIVGALSL